jgi:hypothetical protein
MNNKGHFEPFAHNITSQFGEDGIIEEIFKRIGTKYRICVEFGAWDGIHCSNSRNLWYNFGWNAVLIEADPIKFQELLENTKNFKLVQPVNQYVCIDGENCLENILNGLHIPNDFELLSIDIDGDDYYIFESLKNYSPRVIIIEYNPTIPAHLSIIQNKGEYFGSSAKSIFELAKQKGYQLVHITDTNLILVHNAYFSLLKIDTQELSDIFSDKYINYLFSSYDGELFISNDFTYGVKTYNKKVFSLNKSKTQKPHIDKEFPFFQNGKIQRVFITSKLNEMSSLYQKLPFYKKIRILYHRIFPRNYSKLVIEEWVKKGKPVPPPHEYKQLIIKSYRDKYRTKIFIETGTYLGETVLFSSSLFKQIYSIELDVKLASQAIEKFKDQKQIQILQGDSSDKLKEVLEIIQEPALFWLDGHYSEGITAKGVLNTPIIQELNCIKGHSIKKHVILIDDARCFNGKDDYPTIQELKDKVAVDFPNHCFEVCDDIIRILPSK